MLRVLDKLGKMDPTSRSRRIDFRRPATALEQAKQIVQLYGNLQAITMKFCVRSKPMVSASRTGQEGVGQTSRAAFRRQCGRPERVPLCDLDVSIARGLDYYTGTVFETFLDRSARHRQRVFRRAVRQSGRAFHRARLPGIGASLGLDRLLAAMEELGMIEKVATPAPVFIPYFDPARLHEYLKLAAVLRGQASAWRSFPSRKNWASNSSTPTAGDLRGLDRRGRRIRRRNDSKSKTCKRPNNKTCPWKRMPPALSRPFK